MLTGVLGNFFGYIIKGVSHMRALAKGGEGWKLLTPEILAANKAGGLVEQTFYSDAKASDILNQAIQRLSASYNRLAADASNAMIATSPMVSTLGGTPITLNKTPRQGNPGHSLIGEMDERAAAHGNPVGLMNQAQRSLQTIHSVTPNPIPVNQAIGKNPQIFSYQDMPNVPGLTTIKGVSTGIVAGEAAKWHSLMATLSMQTKQEVAQLKKEIYTTGTVSQEFLSSYSTILPAMTGVIDNAVMKSAQIVQQAQMGQLRIDQAQAKIIAINAQLEADMAATSRMMAQQMGRTANLTTIPLTGESVVDQAGKSNLRAMFRDDRASKRMLDVIARATGVKTYGGGYSIETTIPKKFATGGTVIGGPRSDTTDTQFAYLNEGDFVLNRKASDALLGFNQGGQVPAMVTPGEIVVHNPTQEELAQLSAYNNQYAVGGMVKNSKNNYGILSHRILSNRNSDLKRIGNLKNSRDTSESPGWEITLKEVNARNAAEAKIRAERAAEKRARDEVHQVGKGKARGLDARSFLSQVQAVENASDRKKYESVLTTYLSKVGTTDTASNKYGKQYKANFANILEPQNIPYLNRLFRRAGLKPLDYEMKLHDTHLTQRRYALDGTPLYTKNTAIYSRESNLKANQGNLNPSEFVNRDLKKIAGLNKYEKQLKAAKIPKKLWGDLEDEIDMNIKTFFEKEAMEKHVPLNKLPNIGDNMGGKNIYTFDSDILPIIEGTLETTIPGSTQTSSYKTLNKYEKINRGSNKNPKIEYYKKLRKAAKKFALGGMVGSNKNNYGDISPKFKSQLNKRLGITWGRGLAGDGLTNNPPTSGYGNLALQIGMGKKLFGGYGLSPNTQNLLYDALASELSNTTPDDYIKMPNMRGGTKLVRAMAPNQTEGMLFGAASAIARHKGISKKDKEILAGWAHSLNGSLPKGLLSKITGKMFGYNSGGVVGGRVRGGKYNYGTKVDWSRTPFGMGFKPTGINAPQTENSQQVEMSQKGTSLIGNLGQTAAYMGGSAIGGSLGAKVGGGLGSMAGMILVPAILQSIMQKLGQVSAKGQSTAGVLGKLGPALSNPYVLAGTAVALVTAGLLKYKKSVEETARINRLAFGGGVKPIKDFDSQLKTTIKNIENTRAAAELLHAQMNNVGLPGVSLTIKEFADLREKIKTTHPELIKLFKQNNGDALMKAAAGIKAQFIAAGDSAEVANGKIAALLAESGKSGIIRVVLGNSSVAEIKDTNTAILSMINSLSKLKDAKDKSATILQSLGSMSDYIDKSKDKSSALKEQFNLIAQSNQRNVTLTKEQIVEISKTNPILSEMLDTTDTIATTLAKWRIYISGANKDISSFTNNELQTYATYVESIAGYYDKIADVSSKEAQSNSLTGSMAKEINSWNKTQINAQKNTIASIEKQISLKEKQIAQIKKEADARKKALQDQQQIEDVRLQIQQEQLNYQNALAAGDMSSAAQAQINIQRLVGQQQLKSAENAIDDATQNKIDALQAQIDVLNKKANIVNKESSNSKPKESKLQSTYEAINSLLKEVSMGGNVATDKQVQQYNDLLLQLQKLPNSEKYLQELGAPKAANLDVKDRPYGPVIAQKDISQTAEYASLKTALEKGANSNLVAGKIDTSNTLLKQILEKLPGLNASGLGGIGTKSGAMTLGKDGKSGKADFIVTYGQLRDKGISKENDKFTGADGIEYVLTEDINNKVKGYAAGSSLKPASKEAGGRVVSGREYRVGERGEELFRPDVSGTIYPNPKTAPSVDKSQSFLNRLIHGVKWDKNTQSSALKQEVPFGTIGSIGAKVTEEGLKALSILKNGIHSSKVSNLHKTLIDAEKLAGNTTGRFGNNTMYFARENFAADASTFGTNKYTTKLSNKATDYVSQSKGFITDDILAQKYGLGLKDKYGFSGLAGKDWTPELISKLKNDGYIGYLPADKTGQFTSWMFGKSGFGLKPIKDMVPKFKDGINSVPVDMLAQLHANEAVIPANMNPFNPNASNATMGNTYNFAPVINAAPGMDENALTNILIKRFEASVGLNNVKQGRNRVI
jgi:hypothetical protein